MFVAVGHQGLRLTSRDGESWSEPIYGKEGEVYRGVCFGKGRFVAFGSYGGANIFAATTNGADWSTAQQDAKYSRYVRGITFGQDRFLALGGDPGAVGAANAFGLTSADGLTWEGPHETGAKFVLRRAAFGNGLCVGVGDRGRRAVSKDGGLTWTDVPKPRAIDTLIDIAFGDGLFVGVGLHGLRISTRDGETWSEPQRGQEGEHCNCVAWTGEQFVAIGQGATYFSPDGEKWERIPNVSAPTTAVRGKNAFVGSNWKGRLLHSPDAITWREVHKCDQHVEALAFGEAE
jgi:photosystem II stability/assembly factor-like uncharacterized protein